MHNQNNPVLLGLLVVALIVGVVLFMNLNHKSNRLSAEMTTSTAGTRKKSDAASGSGVSSQAQIAPQSASPSMSQTTINTSGNCTKSTTSKSDQTTSGTTNISSTSVNTPSVIH